MPPVPHRFDLDAVLASARAADGLEDFGDGAFREPLGVLLEAYAAAPVHDLGAADPVERDRRVAEAEAVLMVTELDEPPLHLLLGPDVLAAFRKKLADWQTNLDAWEPVTRDVGFPPE